MMQMGGMGLKLGDDEESDDAENLFK